MLDVLAKHRHALALQNEPLGRTHLVEMSFKLQEGTKQIALRHYKIAHSQEKILDNEMDKLVYQSVITPTISSWFAPVLMVPNNDKSIRLCVDFRKLNSETEEDTYPLPNISEFILN